jgi:hypothetical protein
MLLNVQPTPSEEEREAILVALRVTVHDESGWAAAALLEGVEDDELEP